MSVCPILREGIDARDVISLKEAFDALDQGSTGRVEISKLRKQGYNEQFLKEFKNDNRWAGVNKERLDPFSVLEEGKERRECDEEGMQPCSACKPLLDENVQPGCTCGSTPGDDRSISFDEFFQVMVRKITEERRFSDNIVFESSALPAHGRCVECVVFSVSFYKGHYKRILTPSDSNTRSTQIA